MVLNEIRNTSANIFALFSSNEDSETSDLHIKQFQKWKYLLSWNAALIYFDKNFLIWIFFVWSSFNWDPFSSPSIKLAFRINSRHFNFLQDIGLKLEWDPNKYLSFLNDNNRKNLSQTKIIVVVLRQQAFVNSLKKVNVTGLKLQRLYWWEGDTLWLYWLYKASHHQWHKILSANSNLVL